MTVCVFQAHQEPSLRAEEFLLLLAHGTQRLAPVVVRTIDVVFPQLSTQRSARDSQLLGRQAAMTAGTLERLNNHLFFHALEIGGG